MATSQPVPIGEHADPDEPTEEHRAALYRTGWGDGPIAARKSGPWKSRNVSAKGMSIGRSKWEPNFRPVVDQNAASWPQGCLSIEPSRSTLWLEASLAEDFGKLLYTLAVQHGLAQAR